MKLRGKLRSTVTAYAQKATHSRLAVIGKASTLLVTETVLGNQLM